MRSATHMLMPVAISKLFLTLILATSTNHPSGSPKIQDPKTEEVSAPFIGQSSHPSGPQGERGPGVPDFWVRPGFRVTLVAEELENARFMAFDTDGTLYLSRPENGDIVILRLQTAGNYKVTGTFLAGLSKPHGLYFKDGWLWFTTDGKVSKAKVTPGGAAAAGTETVLTGLPEGGHWWRSILVTDRYFYTSIGDDGNINDDSKTDREKIWRYDLDGTNKHLFVSGIRNTEKLWVRPGTTQIYGCDQGSDWYGQPAGDRKGFQPITDYNPPDEFNHYVDGGFYGHPFIIGNRVPRLEYLSRTDLPELAAKTIPPAWCLGPHWAADGWCFLHSSGMPTDFEGDAIIGLHGSWNRSTKAGYRIERIMFDKVIGIPIGSEMIVGTIGSNGQTVARPVDVVQAPDGTILFSEDQGNKIYRISALKK